MVALLPIPINNRNILQKRVDVQRQTNREVLNEVLSPVPQLLTFKQNPNTRERVLQCSLCRWQLQAWKPVLAPWLPDCPEYGDLHHLERDVCFCCECPKNELGDYVPSDKQHPWRDHNLYRTLSDVNTKVADADLSSRHVQP